MSSNFSKCIRIKIIIKNQNIPALIDSGADCNYIEQNLLTRLDIPLYTNDQNMVIELSNKSELKAQYRATVLLQIGTLSDIVDFIVINQPIGVILGKHWLSTHNPQIDWKNNIVSINGQILPTYDDQSKNNPLQSNRKLLQTLCLTEVNQMLQQSDVDVSVCFLYKITCTDESKQNLNPFIDDLQSRFPNVFKKISVPTYTEITHKIPLINEQVQPPRAKIYPMSSSQLEIVRKQLQELIENNLIFPSSSQFASPILLVKKSDQSYRLCIDYRWLNSQTICSQYPLPLIQDLFRIVRGSIFSKLDFKSGYHQILVNPADQHKTSFICRYGQFAFRAMPFGLSGAPSTFQQIMNKLFSSFIDKFMVIYLDDILVFSQDEETHKKHLSQIFDVLSQNNFRVNLKKCEFFKSQITFLGFLLDQNGLRPDPAKQNIISNWPQPQNVQQVQSFLGLCNFYRKFIFNYAAIAAPLSDLTRKGISFSWDTAQNNAFLQLKQLLSSAPILRLPDDSLPYILNTDASNLSVGAVLQQQYSDGLHPVAFYSKRLSRAEQNYSTYEKEFLAIVLSVEFFKLYIFDREVTLFTDHQSLIHIFNQDFSKLSGKQARWRERLANYRLNIKYKAGEQNVVADALSRIPASSADKELHAQLCFLSLQNSWFQKIKHELSLDSFYSKLLQEPQSATQEKFIVDDGFLFIVKTSGEVVQIIPDSCVQELLLKVHQETGHPSARRMLYFLRFYTFRNKYKLIKQFCATCSQCQLSKNSTQRPIGLLRPLDIPSARFQSYGIDFITHLPKTKNQHVSIMTVVDRLTKYTVLIPLRSSYDAVQVAQQFFKNILLRFGSCVSIISDRDPIFNSKFWRALMQVSGIKLRMSTAYHPQSDGQTERQHRTINCLLRLYASESDWDDWLQFVEYFINVSVSQSTKFAPYKLVYGQDPKLLCFGQTDTPVVDVQNFFSRLSVQLDLVKQAMQKAQAYQSQYANNSRRDYEFKVGQYVKLSTQNIRFQGEVRRFVQPYIGPFKILKIVSSGTAVTLQLPEQYKHLHNTFHVSLILPWQGNIPSSTHVSRQVVIDTDPQFLVELILQHRVKNGQLEFLVKWQDQPYHDCSWQSADSFVFADSKLQKYLDQNNLANTVNIGRV